MKQTPAIGFAYRTSGWLFVGTILIAALAIVAVWISGAPRWLRYVLEAVAISSTLGALVRLARPPVRAIVWRADGGLELALHGRVPEAGGSVPGQLPGTRVMGPLIVMTLRWPPRGRAHLWLLPDNLDADTRRRLRMRLATAASGAGASGNADSG